MGIRKLPPKGPKLDQIIERVKNGEADILWREYGYASRDSFINALRKTCDFRMSELPIKTQPVEQKEPEPPIILNIPKLREYKAPRKKKGDEEIQILVAGDGHGGKVTKSFNSDVYRSRMGKMFESVMTITKLHRNMYPIRKLYILNVGDNTQGENPYQGSILGEVEMGARDQTTKLALPIWAEIICSFRQEFTEVIFEGFPGNHGHERFAPETSREDLRLYDLLKEKLGDKKGITINIHEEFGDKVKIAGFDFFVTHLDGIPCQNGIPLFAIKRRLEAWHIQFGGFDYAIGGHFHKRMHDEVASTIEFFMNASLVSDDLWALKKLGISSLPSQTTLGVHPKQGVTWRYPVVVDEKFLPGLRREQRELGESK